MKKIKHRLVENMSSGAADALGLSRAILCNDTLVAKLNELRDTESTYKRLVDHAKRWVNQGEFAIVNILTNIVQQMWK